MSETLPLTPRWGQSPRSYGGRDEALKMRRRRVEAAYFALLADYRISHNTDALARNRQRCLDEFDTGPALPFDEALLQDGRTNRTIDEARELCLHNGATPAERRTLILRARRYIVELMTLIRSAEAL